MVQQYMRKNKLFIAALVIWLVSAAANAAIDTYQFEDDKTRERFQQLAAELRCPKCQNQNIADSNAPIATDLRAKIHQMLVEERSDEEILDYMIARYGDFVLYQPRVENQTYLLWYGPVVLLLLGIVVVVWIGRRSFNAVSQDDDDELEESQKKQLEMLLQEKDKKTS